MSTQPPESPQSKPVARLGIAALCGVVASGLLYLRVQQLLVERSGGERIAILIAKEELKSGERVTPENLGVQEVPNAYVHVNAIRTTDQDKIVGRKVFRRIKQNQPLLWAEFEPPERERVNETLAKGLRLTPIVVGDHLSKSRFLSPGDFIDILVHFNLGTDRGSVTMTLLQHVQVLEIINNVAMVALTPEQLEQLVFARAHGTLTFGVRNREDIEKQELPSATFQTLLGNFAPVPAPSISPPSDPHAQSGAAQSGAARNGVGITGASKATAAESARAINQPAPLVAPSELQRTRSEKRERN